MDQHEQIEVVTGSRAATRACGRASAAVVGIAGELFSKTMLWSFALGRPRRSGNDSRLRRRLQEAACCNGGRAAFVRVLSWNVVLAPATSWYAAAIPLASVASTVYVDRQITPPVP